jgi:hypothetical protein
MLTASLSIAAVGAPIATGALIHDKYGQCLINNSNSEMFYSLLSNEIVGNLQVHAICWMLVGLWCFNGLILIGSHRRLIPNRLAINNKR